MKQQPSRLKFKKYHKINISFKSLKDQKTFFPVDGLYALKALNSGKLTFKHIEAGRRSIRRTTKKLGNIFIKVFTYASITKKPLASRMGKGKGNHYQWICPIKKGQIIYELNGPKSNICLKALSQAGSKLPFKTKVIKLIY